MKRFAFLTNRRFELAILVLCAVVSGLSAFVFLLEGARPGGGMVLALAVNYFFLVAFASAMYANAPAAIAFFALAYSVFFGFAARNPAYPASDEIVDVLFCLLHASAIGAAFRNTACRIMFSVIAGFVAIASFGATFFFGFLGEWGVAVLSLVLLATFGLGSVCQFAWILQTLRRRPVGFWLRLSFDKVARLCMSVQAFRWQEWLGVALLVLSIIRLWGFFVEFHGWVVGLLMGFYRGAIEWLPQLTVETIAAFFGVKPSPAWIAMFLFVGICVRAADLHSRHHVRVDLWESIKSRIRHGNDELAEDMFATKSVMLVSAFMSAMIVLSVLTALGINPIRYWAGNKIMTVPSIIGICIVAYTAGMLAKAFREAEQAEGGVGVFARIIAVLVRGLLYGLPLLVLAPFIAWRLVLFCTLLAVAIVAVNVLLT